VQPLLEVDSSVQLFNALRSLSVIRCDVPLFGARGLFVALQYLPFLCNFSFEPSTAMLWAVVDNEGRTWSAQPLGEDQRLPLPDDVPKPVPADWASIWCVL
jgi:hypothetical protein